MTYPKEPTRTTSDHANSLQNDARTCQPNGTRLTQPRSPDVLAKTRRDLIALRRAHGADSAIGHRCSNLVELLQLPELPKDLIQRQMNDLARLRAGLQ